MMFRSIKSAVTFIKNLHLTKGYSNESTAEWRRLSMRLTDCGLVQFARRLASRLETENGLLVGVDEQDFNPKIYILERNRYCVLSLTKHYDEQRKRATYAMGRIEEPRYEHSINVARPPTDADLAYALNLIESKSLAIGMREPAEKSRRPRGRSRRQP